MAVLCANRSDRESGAVGIAVILQQQQPPPPRPPSQQLQLSLFLPVSRFLSPLFLFTFSDFTFLFPFGGQVAYIDWWWCIGFIWNRASGLKSQSFIEMIKSAKGSTIDEDLDDEEEFILKKENSATTTHKGMFQTQNLWYFSYRPTIFPSFFLSPLTKKLFK